MKKPKSINLSLVVLTLLFLLSQTTFALTASVSLEGNPQQTPPQATTQDIGTDRSVSKTSVYDDPQNFEMMKAAASAVNADTAAPQVMMASVVTQAVTAAQADPTPAKESAKPVVRYINANELNVRAEANADSKLVGTLKRGDKVTFYENVGEWAKIKTWSDKDGYILAKFLVNSEKEVDKDEAAEPVKKVSRGSVESAKSSEPTDEERSLIQKIVSYSKSLQGVKYVYGGYSTKGFDCSGFTKYVYARYGIELPRSASEYWGFGKKVSRSDLRPGDILLFDTDGGSADVSHVGIYVGNGSFIHASTYKGHVIVMSLAEYRGKYMGARRIIN
ncbi:MAG: NlpC/P60 family protein [Clostridia bacterium]|nr:NlpC/P60 family protein [Clostridia bacterium]